MFCEYGPWTSLMIKTSCIVFSSPQIIFGECFSLYLRSRAFFSYEYIACVYKAVGSFVFGAALSQSLTDIAKYTIGRLRPHFLTVCEPHWSLIDCKSGYIENFTCTGDPVIINEGRWVIWSHALTHIQKVKFIFTLLHWICKCIVCMHCSGCIWFANYDIRSSTDRLSFYSGHSSFSMYCMLFLAVSVFLWQYFICFIKFKARCYRQNHWVFYAQFFLSTVF